MTEWRERRFDRLTPRQRKVQSDAAEAFLKAAELQLTPSIIFQARSALEEWIVKKIRSRIRNAMPTSSDQRIQLSRIADLARDLDDAVNRCGFLACLALAGELMPTTRAARSISAPGTSPPSKIIDLLQDERNYDRERTECELTLSAPAAIAAAAERAVVQFDTKRTGRPRTGDIDDQLIRSLMDVFRTAGVEPKLRRDRSREVEGRFADALRELYESLPQELKPKSCETLPRRAYTVQREESQKSR